MIDVQTDGRWNTAKRLARAGRIDELREWADAGDGHAARHLAVWLARAGHLDELRDRMAAGDRSARWAYSDWLVRHRRIPEAIDVLRPLATPELPGAQRRLACLLAGLGRYAQAMSVLAKAPPHWRDDTRVQGWLRSRGLIDRSDGGPVRVRREYLDALRRELAAGDADAKQQLSWIVLLWWRWWQPRLGDAVALLDDIGPGDWLHERLVLEARGWRLGEFRAAAIDRLATVQTTAYHRTRAALLMLQGQRDAAVTQLRSLAADGDRHAQRDLATILDAELPQREIRIGDHPNPVNMTGIAFSPDGTTLAAWGHGGTIWARAVVWDVVSGTQRHAQPVSSPWLGGVVFRPDGTLDEVPGDAPWRHLYAVTAPDGTVRAVRAGGRLRLRSAAGAVLRDIPAPATVAMAFNPDSTMLATGAGTTGVHLWHTATGELIRTIATPAARAMAFNADSTVLATSAATDVRLWHTATGKLIRTITTPTVAMAFHPDGTMLATADSLSGTIRLWSLVR